MFHSTGKKNPKKTKPNLVFAIGRLQTPNQLERQSQNSCLDCCKEHIYSRVITHFFPFFSFKTAAQLILVIIPAQDTDNDNEVNPFY